MLEEMRSQNAEALALSALHYGALPPPVTSASGGPGGGRW